MWTVVGEAAFIGMGGLAACMAVLCCPITGLVKAVKAKMALSDKRMTFQKELFENIKVLKMYSWDVLFRDRIVDIRREEVSKLGW